MNNLLLISVLLAQLIIFGVLAFLAIHLRRLIRKSRAIEKELKLIPPFVWASQNLQRSIPLDRPLPNWNGWSMPPDLLIIIVNIINSRKPKIVVEFGSGISTVVIASLLKEHGGRLISFEHDSDYARRQLHTLEGYGLAGVVDLRIAPIGSKVHPPFNHRWYDIDVNDLPYEIDLVVVDGPPAALGAEVRFPGGDLTISRLALDGCIVFDDANRIGEQRIKQALSEKYANLVICEPPTIRGCYLITKES